MRRFDDVIHYLRVIPCSSVSSVVAAMPLGSQSALRTKSSSTPVFYYDEEKNEYVSNKAELITDLPDASLMERTSSSLSFFQNIMNSESSSALRLAWTVLLREMTDDLTDVALKINSLQRNSKLKDQQLLDNVSHPLFQCCLPLC
ncbi:hypothetical protein GE061_016983 [Apolygus lucorum]|uniref:Uncharacterized protein n=1 Tax=Apolygus lucorum TaxID=248454 RepID=A0A8S9XLP9_APOLU|nr:hypothetical protein GE061_016983 [Apolygus lucorum]